MTNASSLFRSLIIYSVCLPLALVVGYMLAAPTDYSSVVTVGILFGLLTIPLFLRWHYPWMIAGWNMSAILFFLPGRPAVNIPTIGASITISVLQYVLNRRMKFISVPSMTKPLLFITMVVLITARFTGGMGLNSLGASGNVGGKRYVILLLGIVGYFALTAAKIPPEKRKFYTFLFFGGTLTMAISNLAYILTPGLSFIFLIFPTDQAGLNALTDNPFAAEASITRLGGLSAASGAVMSLMLAFYGIRGFLDTRRWWRLPFLLLMIVATLFGGYRSAIIIVALTLAVLFYMEGLAHTQVLPIVILVFILCAAIAIPSIRKLPLTVQRSLAFLPIDIDPIAAQNAAGSTEWRVEMWEEVLPQVPQYLLLGKGLAINLSDLNAMNSGLNKADSQYNGSMLAGDYHNGPLSLIMPFGLFGVAGFIWFLVAGCKILNRNYKYGDPDLLNINRFLLAQFIVKIIIYFTIFGSFYSDLMAFTGLVGFSIALNGGVAAPAAAPVPHPVFNRFKVAANAAR